MPDPFRKVRPGERIQFGASWYNAVTDAAKAERARQGGRSFGDLAKTREAAIVKVRNDTGGPLNQCCVVGLNGPIFDPGDDVFAFLQQVAFSAVVPSLADHAGKIAILLEPIPDGAVGRAYVSGVCPVFVDVLDVDHGWADVADAETGHLASDPNGSAQILWKESDALGGYGYGYTTGVQWALVRLGGTGPTSCVAKVTTEIQKATSTTRPGKGKIKRYTTLDMTTTPATVGGLSAVDEDAVSINKDKKIAVNSTVIGVKLLGVWWVTTPDSCGSLL